LLLSLPQRRWLFTNADANHAHRVMSIVGVEGCFEGIIDIHALQFACKPDQEAYVRALELAGEKDPARCVLFDDAPRNLAPARQMGIYTVLIGSQTPNPAASHTISSLHQLPGSLPELWKGAQLQQAPAGAAAEAPQ
jgi:FMN phosphatase YigB (HAD superfamily)